MLRGDIEDLQKRYQVCGTSYFSASFSSSESPDLAAAKDKIEL